MSLNETVNVRYMVNDVAEAVEFYCTHFDFQTRHHFSSVRRRHEGQPSPAAERTCELGRSPHAGRHHRRALEDGTASTSSRPTSTRRSASLKEAGVRFRNEVVSGPGGRQVLVEDPSGNVIELFQPAAS